MLAALPGCGGDGETSPPPAGPGFRYEPGSADFFATPWPSDHRVLADGTVDLGAFPRQGVAIVASMVGAIEGTIVGFSTMPTGYFQLQGDFGVPSLPTPSESLAEGAAVQLVAVGADHCGQRIPVEMQISVANELDPFLPGNVLQITPVPGFVLHQKVPYAFIVNRSFGSASGHPAERPPAWDAYLLGSQGGSIADSLEPLRSCAAEGAIELDEVALATVFTVQDVVGPARALREAVADPTYSDAPQINGWAESAPYSGSDYTSYTATYETPIFQTGVSPYDEGGDIVFDDEGRPAIQGWEQVPMIVIVPDGTGPYPVALWVDGTGWGQWSHVSSSLTQALLDAGFAVASYMPQFHGERATPGAEPEMHTYNFFNPAAGRNVLRQQMADTSYFIRVLREAVPAVAGAPELDCSRLVLGGQSQGAQNGAMLAAIEPEVHAFVLNGLAAYLTITVLERKDVVDYEGLLKSLVGIHGELDRFHPVLAMLQLGADSVDLHNYATVWKGWEGNPTGADLFVLNGYQDFTTHPIGMNAVTIAGDLAPVEPPGWDVDPFGVWERQPETLPIAGNRPAFDGGSVTLATYLDGNTSHFTIYDLSQERARAVAFLVDALDGMPTLAP
ncbi:MAG: hypothetical protein JRI68_23395 [Deltaproteobacteria bacterium]|nr:hypothetical protein [Deltaproteobacteria bacterium]